MSLPKRFEVYDGEIEVVGNRTPHSYGTLFHALRIRLADGRIVMPKNMLALHMCDSYMSPGMSGRLVLYRTHGMPGGPFGVVVGLSTDGRKVIEQDGRRLVSGLYFACAKKLFPLGLIGMFGAGVGILVWALAIRRAIQGMTLPPQAVFDGCLSDA